MASVNRFRSILRRLATVAVTLAVTGAAAGAVVAGRSLLDPAADVAPVAAPAPTPVETRPVVLEEGYEVRRRFVGQVEPPDRVEPAFELGGRLIEVLVDEGDEVARGAPLARLDTSLLDAERRALEAERAAALADADLARLTLGRTGALTDRGFSPAAARDEARLTLARAEARARAVEARIDGVDARLDRTVIHAPFDGRVGPRFVDPGQTIGAGQAVLVLYSEEAARLRVGVTPALAATLAPGRTLMVESGGVSIPGEVAALRPDLDPATRTREVLVALPRGSAPAYGDTAAVVVAEHVPAHGFWAPLAALREGARGSWSVLVVEPHATGHRVVAAPVEVLHADGAAVYLGGDLPAGARFVGSGPDRVVPGQAVAALAGRAS